MKKNIMTIIIILAVIAVAVIIYMLNRPKFDGANPDSVFSAMQRSIPADSSETLLAVKGMKNYKESFLKNYQITAEPKLESGSDILELSRKTMDISVPSGSFDNIKAGEKYWNFSYQNTEDKSADWFYASAVDGRLVLFLKYH